MKRKILHSNHGVTTIEFMLMTPILLVLIFGIAELGSMVHERNIITHLAREGANVASRNLDVDLDPDKTVLDFLVESSEPLDFEGNKERYKMFYAVARADIPTEDEPIPKEPVCTVVADHGKLPKAQVQAPAPETNCGLTVALWEYLRPDGEDPAPVSQFTIIRVYYKHEAITPLAGLLPLLSGEDSDIGDDTILSSTAIF